MDPWKQIGLQPFQHINQNLWERKAHRAGHRHSIENPGRCALKCFRKTRLSQTMGENQLPFYFTEYLLICKCAKKFWLIISKITWFSHTLQKEKLSRNLNYLFYSSDWQLQFFTPSPFPFILVKLKISSGVVNLFLQILIVFAKDIDLLPVLKSYSIR